MDDLSIAGLVIPGSLKRSPSYHSEYEHLTYGELKRLAAAKPPDGKARQMKKLMDEVPRLLNKAKRPRH